MCSSLKSMEDIHEDLFTNLRLCAGGAGFFRTPERTKEPANAISIPPFSLQSWTLVRMGINTLHLAF